MRPRRTFCQTNPLSPGGSSANIASKEPPNERLTRGFCSRSLHNGTTGVGVRLPRSPNELDSHECRILQYFLP
jgi:hypothetical protein